MVSRLLTVTSLTLAVATGACGTTAVRGDAAKVPSTPTSPRPASPTSDDLSGLCGTLYDSEAGAECRLGERAKELAGVAVMEVTAVQGDYSHLLMAHADGSWHAVLELPSNGDQQGAHIESYKVEHQLSVGQIKGQQPHVMLLSSHEATFKGTDGKSYSSYANHTAWCAWLPAGPKCCGGVTTEVKVDRVEPASVQSAWKMAVAFADGQARVTKVHGEPGPTAVKALGAHPMCAFPVSAAKAFDDLYGGVPVER